jgi:choline kinase
MNKINVLIPMAGNGSRFEKAGYTKPKPFIEINGKKMVEIVIDNITPTNTNQFILITRTHHTIKDELVKYGEIILANL